MINGPWSLEYQLHPIRNSGHEKLLLQLPYLDLREAYHMAPSCKSIRQ